MSELSLGELLKVAKGEDRSLREYAKASGVDPAIVSKMINGAYTPKKPEVYEALTSESAAPRGGITYEDLLKAADFSSSYRAGLVAAFTAALLDESTLDEAPTDGDKSKQKSFSSAKFLESQKQLQKERQKFEVICSGIIMGKLAQQGIQFVSKSIDPNTPIDIAIELKETTIKELALCCNYYAKGQDSSFSISKTITLTMGKLVMCKPDPDRLVILTTNSNKAMEYLLNHKGNLAYKGNLAVLLIDESIGNPSQFDMLCSYDNGTTEIDFTIC